MKIRLNKYISEAGICSRREADRKIEQGKVRVNGREASLGDVVGEYDKVLVDGNPIKNMVQRVYLAYNKPVGVTSTTERSDPDNIIKAVGYHGGRIFPVGRLDKDSHGLILLTNDGDIVNKILRVSNEHDKEYLVTTDKPVTDDFIKKMGSGVDILGIKTKACPVEPLGTHGFKIILQQGMNRQIRRMCKALGYTVRDLQRVRIMHIQLDSLATGTWRFLDDNEIATLLEKVSDSDDKPAKRSPYRTRKPVNKPGKYSHPEPETTTKGRPVKGGRSGRPGKGPGRGSNSAKSGKPQRSSTRNTTTPKRSTRK
ncbi:MAG: 23S rRNA pseudouridine(2604) synthase RluF [Bacteroidetes bacterium]|nr:23S rRNA pseudouridine(2604) synthase RluF [Bacteroidota bacterium]MCH8524706.1 23S rRNA pseudouridine(2604) synthase RluF [Balneolales bacterium]